VVKLLGFLLETGCLDQFEAFDLFPWCPPLKLSGQYVQGGRSKIQMGLPAGGSFTFSLEVAFPPVALSA
jgi:hypothetical protein